MSSVKFNGPPSWSLDASETGESTKFPMQKATTGWFLPSFRMKVIPCSGLKMQKVRRCNKSLKSNRLWITCLHRLSISSYSCLPGQQRWRNLKEYSENQRRSRASWQIPCRHRPLFSFATSCWDHLQAFHWSCFELWIWLSSLSNGSGFVTLPEKTRQPGDHLTCCTIVWWVSSAWLTCWFVFFCVLFSSLKMKM